ncbi:hypothetical protein KBX06_02890 [Micromonospora sp. C31]|uniref:hypothetical protein n=1 Tax=Micromonospora sp. C31 TaxID=2824876 RepID=UPI001B37E74E|nr:hypothetical protein [Micromonospora sp. C31]MBQ1072117.1 hypothetical protein [Micromonospora sp. C31]
MSDRDKPSRGRLRQHLGSGEWAGIGAVVGLLSALVALLAWLFPVRDDQGTATPSQPTIISTDSPIPPTTQSANKSTPTPSAISGDSNTSSDPAGAPKREVTHSSGSPRFQNMDEYGINDGRNVNYWEMDENKKRHTGHDDTDLVLGANFLGGANGTVFASLANGTPSLERCSQIDGTAWTPQVPASQMKAGFSLCVRTSEGRQGKLEISKVFMCEKYLRDEGERERFRGDICVLEVSFVVWE